MLALIHVVCADMPSPACPLLLVQPMTKRLAVPVALHTLSLLRPQPQLLQQPRMVNWSWMAAPCAWT
jgi:hypothetical protein